MVCFPLSYRNGFQVNANKFPWAHGAELCWQEGLVYCSVGIAPAATAPVATDVQRNADGSPSSAQVSASADTTASRSPALTRAAFWPTTADPGWRRKAYLFDPPWLPKAQVCFVRRPSPLSCLMYSLTGRGKDVCVRGFGRRQRQARERWREGGWCGQAALLCLDCRGRCQGTPHGRATRGPD